MATNIDTLLNGTTVSVDGSAITISGLSANEQAILAIALAALNLAQDQGGITGGRAVSARVMLTTSGTPSTLVVTPGAG